MAYSDSGGAAQGRWRTRAVWITLALIILLTAALRARLLAVPLERDEGEYAYAGQLMLQGVPPYELAYNMKMPGIYAAYALMMGALGESHVAIHLGLLLVNAATIVLLFLLARSLFGPAAGLMAAASFAVLSAGQEVQGPFANAEHFVILPALGGLVLLLRAIDAASRWRLFAAAAVLGLAPLMKQHGASFVLFGGLFLVYSEVRRRPFSLRGAAGRAGLYAVGAAVPFGLTCLLLWWAGVFGTFWFWTFDYAREYVSSVSLGFGLGMLRERIAEIPPSALGLWLLSAAGLLSTIWNRATWRHAPFALGFLLFSFLAVCPGFYFRPHYFVLMLPAVALFGGLGAEAVRSAAGRLVRAPAAIGLTIALCVALLGHALYQQREFFFRLGPLEATRQIYGGNPFPESLEIARFIRQHSGPQDLVAVLGSEPQIYFYSDRRSATGFIYTYGLMENHPYSGRMQRQMIAEIEAARPKFLVFVKVPTSWLARPESDMTIFSWLERYRQEHYQIVGVADIGWPQETVYRWGVDALRYRPRSQYGVVVMVRRP